MGNDCNHYSLVQYMIPLRTSRAKYHTPLQRTIPVYWISSCEMLRLLLTDDLIDLKTLFNQQCKRQFIIFRELCRTSFINNLYDNITIYSVIQALSGKNDFRNVPFLKKNVDTILKFGKCPPISNSLLKTTVCYYALKCLLFDCCFYINEIAELVVSLVDLNRFSSKHAHVRRSNTLA